MARAYQEAHLIENIASTTKLLQSQVTELSKSAGHHEDRIQKLTAANAELAAKNSALETRMAAKYVFSPLAPHPAPPPHSLNPTWQHHH